MGFECSASRLSWTDLSHPGSVSSSWSRRCRPLALNCSTGKLSGPVRRRPPQDRGPRTSALRRGGIEHRTDRWSSSARRSHQNPSQRRNARPRSRHRVAADPPSPIASDPETPRDASGDSNRKPNTGPTSMKCRVPGSANGIPPSEAPLAPKSANGPLRRGSRVEKWQQSRKVSPHDCCHREQLCRRYRSQRQ